MFNYQAFFFLNLPRAAEYFSECLFFTKYICCNKRSLQRVYFSHLNVFVAIILKKKILFILSLVDIMLEWTEGED